MMQEAEKESVDLKGLPPLPSGWAWCLPSDLCSVVASGSTPKPDKMYAGIGDVPFIKVYNLTDRGHLDFSNKPTFIDRETHLGPLGRSRAFPGDVLINIVGPPLGKVSVVPDDHPEWNINQAVVVFRPREALLNKYLAFAFLTDSIMRRVTSLAKATAGQHNIGVSMCRNLLPVPVAPLKEQHRIVAKIEELFSDLDAGVVALKRAKANVKRYRVAVLKAAVEGKLTTEWRAKHPKTESASKLLERILLERRKKWEADQLAKFAEGNKEPPKNWKANYAEPFPSDTTNLPKLPEGWCWAKLDQLLVYLRNGYFQSPTGAEEGTPILRINAVRPMRVDLTEVRFLDKINGDVTDYFVENGDLLFTRYNGSVDLLGVAGMVRDCTDKVLHPDKLIRVKLGADQPLPAFVEIASNVGASRRHMVGRARTTAGQTGISGPDVKEMPIPLPPMDEQQQIVTEVEEKLSLIDDAERFIETSLARAARLRQSILKQAFEGNLVPQDPNDEPASVLLERLSASRSNHKENGKEPKSPRTKGRKAMSK